MIGREGRMLLALQAKPPTKNRTLPLIDTQEFLVEYRCPVEHVTAPRCVPTKPTSQLDGMHTEDNYRRILHESFRPL